MSMSLEEVPVRRIESESFDELKGKEDAKDDKDSDSGNSEESTSFLKEFMALLFPPVTTTIKRVEYRPNRIRPKPALPKQFVFKPVASQDESFLLKLVEIYLKAHHRHVTDFLPKCLNYHLIGRLKRELPLKLLLKSENFGGGFDVRGQVQRIKGIIKIIDEINF